jgi:oligopeptide transport system substrate-binding protein
MKFLNRASLLLCLAAVIVSPACTKKKPADSDSSSVDAGAKKIFYHYRTSEEKTLDPMKQFDQASHSMIMNLYDTLLEYHYLKRPYELTPGLLEKMPEKQPDGTFKLTLRKGVMFHDNACFPGGKGRELVADDVIFSMKRFADANVNSLSYSIIGGLIDGIDAFREASKKAGKAFDYSKNEISGVKKLDNYSISVKFTQDSPLNFYPLAFTGMSIMAPEGVQKYGDAIDKNPVGTGPFTLKSYSRRGTTILQKNPKYWAHFPADGNPEDKDMVAEGANRQLPLVDEVYLPLIEETQPQMLKFIGLPSTKTISTRWWTAFPTRATSN